MRCGSGRALASDPNHWAPLLSGSTLGLGLEAALGLLCVVLHSMFPTTSQAHGDTHISPAARETQSLSVSPVAKTTLRHARSPDDSDRDGDNDDLCIAGATVHVNAIDYQPRSHRLHTPLAHPSRRITPKHGILQLRANLQHQSRPLILPVQSPSHRSPARQSALTDRALPNPRPCLRKRTTAATAATSPGTLPT